MLATTDEKSSPPQTHRGHLSRIGGVRRRLPGAGHDGLDHCPRSLEYAVCGIPRMRRDFKVEKLSDELGQHNLFAASPARVDLRDLSKGARATPRNWHTLLGSDLTTLAWGTGSSADAFCTLFASRGLHRRDAVGAEFSGILGPRYSVANPSGSGDFLGIGYRFNEIISVINALKVSAA